MNFQFLVNIGLLIVGICFFYLDKEEDLTENLNEIIYFTSLPEFDFKNKVVVDVGCGKTGDLLRFFHEKKGVRGFYAIDFENVIEIAKENNPEFEKMFRVGIGEEIPFKDESVDILIFQRTFHHVGDFEKAVSEMSRVLKERGHVVFIEPVSVWGRYEILSLGKYFIYEEEEKKKAYELIKTGVTAAGLYPLKFEKFLVTEITTKVFEEIVSTQEPEVFDQERPYYEKYINKIAREDGVEVDDLVFFANTRINIWEKKKKK